MTDFALFNAVLSSSANGTPIGTPPPNCIGVQFYLASNASVTYAIVSAQPSGPPPNTWTVSQATTGYSWTEKLSPGQNIYVTAESGSPLFRWILGG
jgi:hypothetical protein